MSVKLFVKTEGGTTWFEFNVLLHNREGSTFHVFAGKGYSRDDRDTVFLRNLLERFMRGDTGIEMISITPYTMVINHSRAITGEDIQGWLSKVAKNLSKEVEVVGPG
jgi:hypothetical protein